MKSNFFFINDNGQPRGFFEYRIMHSRAYEGKINRSSYICFGKIVILYFIEKFLLHTIIVINRKSVRIAFHPSRDYIENLLSRCNPNSGLRFHFTAWERKPVQIMPYFYFVEPPLFLLRTVLFAIEYILSLGLLRKI